MPRVPVPDDYEGSQVTVAGTNDHHYGYADVNRDDVEHARPLTVRSDEDGRYVGPGDDDLAADVADYLGVTLDSGDSEGDDSGNEADGESKSDGDPDTCQTVKSDGEVCGRDLPCPYHSDED